MFTSKVQSIIDTAKDIAYSAGVEELTLESVVAATAADTEGSVLLAESVSKTADEIRSACGRPSELLSCPRKLPLSESVRAVLSSARQLASQIPDRSHPGQVGTRHIVCALVISPDACRLLGATPVGRDDVVTLLAAWYEKDMNAVTLEGLTGQVRQVQEELLEKVFGQDHAVHTFVEGLFNADVVAAADVKRRAPKAVFVFAGPPGVGKTFLAELGTAMLQRPFRRFDMSAYADGMQTIQLVGFSGAHPGLLTQFVEKNPSGVLLFDEIEKAHSTVIHLFLQILDAGVLEDKFFKREVAFRDTTIIFTTNAGRRLYDRPNESGVHRANAAFHRKTILDALENEINPRTRQPFFPAAICSRLATGYPVLFNYLRVNDLDRVVRAELSRVATLFELQYFKTVAFDDLLSMCLLFKEGGRSDARTLRSQTETFVKTEIFKFCQLFKTDRLEDVLDQIDQIEIGLEQEPTSLPPEIAALFQQQDRPRVLLVADSPLIALYPDRIAQIDWRTARTAEDAVEILAQEDIDMVLLDLWLGRESVPSQAQTLQHLDRAAPGARELYRGQEALRKIRERLPNMPVYLLILDQRLGQGGHGPAPVDESAFLACVRSGGARGLVVSGFRDGTAGNWELRRDELAHRLTEIGQRLHLEKAAQRLGQERKVLNFDTVPHLLKDSRTVAIHLRNLRLTRALASADAGEVLDDVERPHTSFDDVIGAESAKQELKFFIDYLKSPRRFAALGLKPPKGVLLHGPPGTGKTMLARAMAGESQVAFVPCVASNLESGYVAGGAENIRNLFDRARRYAPAIIFVDEIDAIGKVRSGSHADSTLNALLTEMDGFNSPSPDRPIFVLAATNFDVDDYGSADDDPAGRRVLDPALVRRFSRTILVDLPNREARLTYLNRRLKGRPNCTVTDETITEVANRSAGMAIANLELIIETAGRRAAEAQTDLTGELLLEALKSHPMPDDIERPTTRFDNVIGADAAKEELKFFIDFLKDPNRLADLGFKPPKGVLLYGPPGTGKTLLARAMAGESNVAFLPTTGTSFVTMWQGSGPQNLRKLFARARRRAPAIVFIDEIDAIGKARTGTAFAGQSEEKTLNALLTEMDGFVSPSPDKPVLILAATNYEVTEDDSDDQRNQKKLDPALLSRFSRKIKIELPDRAARCRFVEMWLESLPVHSVTQAGIAHVGGQSRGMNLRELGSMLEAAARSALRAGQRLNDPVLEATLETVRYGEKRDRDHEKALRTARHEAGHTIMYWSSGCWASYVTIVSRGNHGGYMAPCSDEAEKLPFLRQDFLDDILVSLGGRAAEIVCYGEKEGLSLGPHGDLKRASLVARKMVVLLGMDDQYGLEVYPMLTFNENALNSPIHLKINKAVNRILKEQMEVAMETIRKNRQYLDRMVDALMEKETLKTDELQAILPPLEGDHRKGTPSSE